MAWRDNELAAQAADALGDPDGVYHLSPLRTAAFATLGSLLAAWGAIGTFLWFFVLNAGMKGIKGYALLILVPAGLGITMLWKIWQSRGLTVLTYPTGILVVNRQNVWSFPWDEIATIRIGNGKEAIIDRDATGSITTVAVPGSNTAWFGGTNSLTIETTDGREGVIPVAVPGFTALTVRVQRETFPRLWNELWAKFQAGERGQFGLVFATMAGITSGKKELLWTDYQKMTVGMTNVVIRKKTGWSKDWLNTPLTALVNVNLLIRLAEEMKSK